MYIHVTPTTIEREMNAGATPVLLACLHPDAETTAQAAMLDAIATSYRRRVKVCLLCDKLGGASKNMYAIEGTPTYLIIVNRAVRERVLGQTDQRTLTRLLDRALNGDAPVGAHGRRY
jgi:hypothetical protein